MGRRSNVVGGAELEPDVYDYVVVGAGSAGCALAARLSAHPDVEVALVEAGADRMPLRSRVPAAYASLFASKYDWTYYTTPQRELGGRSLFWPRGKLMGGSSAMNAMVYIRGNQADFDGWSAAGAHEWGMSDVLPYFLRSENNSRGASNYHGVGGPLDVVDLSYRHPLSQKFVESAIAAGLRPNDDFNGASQDGVGYYQVNQRDGRRASSASAFLTRDVRRRLQVLAGAQVQRVVLDRGRAIGVEVAVGAKQRLIRARREVILCAGAIGSPALLQSSGVGPAASLERAGIRVQVDLPLVGKNLQDHLAIGLAWNARDTPTMEDALRPGAAARYVFGRTGPLSSNIVEAGGFVALGGSAPDIQFHFAPVVFWNHGRERPPVRGFTIGVTLLTPGSRGEVVLPAAGARPTIDPGYLRDPSDLAKLAEGLALAREIGEQPIFASVRGDTWYPDNEPVADTKQWIRQRAETMYHPVGTCAIGGVVDSSLRVYGVENLRICDASVMPTITRGNTHAPTVMLAERAAALLTQTEGVIQKR
ncbi:GMC family oxidoreductase [Nocardia camponoti]|uniref:Choline dehydrogenase n=1 Tax=Nocardia camponoti TaxID=1616106 RepID=A0A917QQ05_9NOCA|nr:GMC family oxidoreductase N-terminal domain-containing protein [Nocardia camponoti]GGK63154.1 choline dehydrogenase [Nocardia camponoti]